MVEDITPERIANSIMQDFTFKGVHVVVEGVNDSLLFSKFCSNDSAQIKIAQGFQRTVDSVLILNGRGFTRAIGIIDADFFKVDDEVPNHENLFVTDDHDIEIMIFKSDAFNTVLKKYSIPGRVDSFKEKAGIDDLRVTFLDLTRPLAFLKWINKRRSLGLAFGPKNLEGNELAYGDFISMRELTFLGLDAMAESVINYNVNKSQAKYKKEQLVAYIMEVQDKPIDSYQLCNGHDICQVISLSMRRAFSNLNAKDCQWDQIEGDLILSYDSMDFSKTHLYQQIKLWEARRQLQVLKF